MTHTLVIHGGAGTMRAAAMTPALAEAHHEGLRRALRAGHAILAQGGSALDAVTEAVIALEDDPLFNAARGAVFTAAGKLEMDAAIMDGRTRAAGAVAGICGPRNPIRAARAVMEHAGTVLLVGQAATGFAAAQGLPIEPEAYFHTDRRWQALQTELARRAADAPDTRDDAQRHGTVGAVARDVHGHLAAATSTGGMTAKRPGRVGDTPIIGAGTWADRTAAISATGTGEVFIRHAAAHEIAARLRLAHQPLAEAAHSVVEDLLADGGDGGLIAIDADGNTALPFNSAGMYRGTIGSDGRARTAIYREALG